MVTGDNKTTARAIARECKIIDEDDPEFIKYQDYIIMEGP